MVTIFGHGRPSKFISLSSRVVRVVPKIPISASVTLLTKAKLVTTRSLKSPKNQTYNVRFALVFLLIG